MKMRVLITGATGLIGTEIVKLCHDKNIAVNFLTTSQSKLSKDNNYKGFLNVFGRYNIMRLFQHSIKEMIFIHNKYVNKKYI